MKTTTLAVLILISSFLHGFSQAPVKQWDADLEEVKMSSSPLHSKQKMQAISKQLPGSEKVAEVYPNPVLRSATASFSLTKASRVTISITDTKGRLLKLITDQNFSEGNHKVNFSRGSLQAGAYFLQIKTGNGTLMQKLVVE